MNLSYLKILIAGGALALGLAACSNGGSGGGGNDDENRPLEPDTTPPTTIATPSSGAYNTAQSVTLACDDGAGAGCASTYYTTDGSDPDTSATVYDTAIAIDTDTILKFFSVDLDANRETTRSASYIIDRLTPTVSATPPGGTFPGTVFVSLNCTDVGSGCAAIHYTTDNSEPTAGSPSYSNPIGLQASVTIKFFAIDHAGNVSAVQSEIYTLPTSSVVEPLYGNAPDWNDYVRNDGGDWLSASNTACDGNETGDYRVCLHGGELRVVNVTGRGSCAGLTANDALDAFDWTCDDSTLPVRMVTRGLNDNKNLSDLLDFAAAAWRLNSVIVTDGGATVLDTSKAVWWHNPVLVDNDGGVLTAAGTIYIVTSNPDTEYEIAAHHAGFVVKPGMELSAPAAADDVVHSTAGIAFLWYEGAVHIQGTNNGVWLPGIKFSRIRNASVTGVGGSGANAFEATPTASVLSRLSVVFGANDGVHIGTAHGNLFSDITVASNNHYGFTVNGGHNVLQRISAHNNGYAGVVFQGSQTIQSVYAAGNVYFGVISYAANNSYITNVSAANNGTNGLLVSDKSANNILVNILSVNHENIALGFTISSTAPGPVANLIENVAVSHARLAIILNESSNNRFTGLTKVGNSVTNDCYVTGGTNPGLVDTTCANEGASDATLVADISLAASVFGKVTSDDALNNDDVAGLAEFSSITDWINFVNEARVWGRDGSLFPNADHRGPCAIGENCRIWDWSLTAGDDIARGVLAKHLAGNAADTLTHTWAVAAPNGQADCSAAVPGSIYNAGQCRSTFLRNAVELLADAIGNEDGLCNSQETCLYTPNIGAYQGHGALVSAGDFSNGDTLSNIKLLQYTYNGR